MPDVHCHERRAAGRGSEHRPRQRSPHEYFEKSGFLHRPAADSTISADLTPQTLIEFRSEVRKLRDETPKTLHRRLGGLPTAEKTLRVVRSSRQPVAVEPKPFDSIEDSLEYLGLLREAIDSNKKSVTDQLLAAQGEGAARRLEALQLVAYKLDRLAWHIDGTHRILNDLRTLRRLLLGERRHKK